MQATAGSTRVAHRAYADEGSIWRLVCNSLNEGSIITRCVIAFCLFASLVGWLVMIGLMLLTDLGGQFAKFHLDQSDAFQQTFSALVSTAVNCCR